jgi:hypothetical protein
MATNTNSDESSTRTPPADQDWFGGRRWTGIAAIGFLIVVAVCVLIVVIGRHGSGPGSAGAPPAAQPATPATPLPTAVPTTAPAGTAWTIYETVALPTLPGAGPAHIDGAIATGYAHTPLGALLAVANEGYRYVLADDGTWRQAAGAMLAPGAGYDAWLRVRSGHPYGPQGATSGGGSFAQIVGFQFVSYTPTDAVVQLATRDSSGNLQVGANHATWVNNDWRFVPAANGGLSANTQRIDSLNGFVEWRGV